MVTTTKKTMKYNRIARQAGMTLIELTVVLLVLVGLAGLLVPYVGGFADKTHDATGANSISELDSTILRFQADKMRFPDKMENLISSTAGTDAMGSCAPTNSAIGTVYCKLMQTSQFTPLTLDSDMAMSLGMAGINTVLPADNTTTDATFKAVNAAAPVTIAATAKVAEITNTTVGGVALTTEEHMAKAFGGVPTDYDKSCYAYVAFGIGENNEMIGTHLHAAPVHFASQGAMGPTAKYNRFIAVYQIDRTTAAVPKNTFITATGGATNNPGCDAGNSPAKFIGTGMNMGTGYFIGKSANEKWVYERIAAN
jgi:type II secretory pathway pseudopilin PulG